MSDCFDHAEYAFDDMIDYSIYGDRADDDHRYSRPSRYKSICPPN